MSRIVIAVITRARSEALRRSLSALAAQNVPEGAELTLLVVENGDDGLAAGIAAEVAPEARVVVEPRLGIPHARNRAVEEALSLGAQWLAFVDDDEVAPPGWISALRDGAVAGGHDLAGGPVRPVPGADAGPREAEVAAWLARRAAVRDARRASGTGRLDLPTNNWIVRLAALERAGLRFDDKLLMTGGSDTDLSRRAQAAGLKLGWVPAAELTDEWPASRLRAGYIFRRARSQTLAKAALSPRRRSAHLMAAFLRGAGGGLRVLLWPLARGPALDGVRSLGIAAGHASAAFGAESRLYETTDGR
ncbi:glycosyltransferase [Roseicyclus sp. F158]|uniref:Glycosyltransferase n=1 Tax=Tropicimonas omnivorans TaxID=3075590 RepID=A0ABU3DJA2_9RHOB|nr:glycosyltransferase [Roseicyclus sp. F158]MDT0683777.1 glycosyltransferase [Roseicyclus sp. F158]